MAIDEVNRAKEVINNEIKALELLKEKIDDAFIDIVECIINCKGKVILCGMGKSGHIARKISATMASLGTPSFFLHPAEAQHGDMGMISSDDIVILISNSGETEEVIRTLPSIKIIGAKTIAITSKTKSTLAKECDLVQIMPDIEEACNLNLAPTSSTTAVLAYGDALAIVASEKYGFTKEDFGLFHPSGSLGKKLIYRVRDIMASDNAIPIINEKSTISDAIMEMSVKGLGMVIVTEDNGKLIGLVTDGDLRRAIEKKVDLYNDLVSAVMTKNPMTIKDDVFVVRALHQLKENRKNNYPVVDDNNIVIGAITWQMIIRAGIMI